MALASALSAAAMLVSTVPKAVGDAPEYAADAIRAASLTTPELWESGHLIWRPVGFLLRPSVQLDDRSIAIRTVQSRLTVIASLSAIVAAVALGQLALQFWGSMAAALVTTVLFITSPAVVNHSQSGTSYVPGLAVLALAMATGWRTRSSSVLRVAATGALLALSALLWLPYVFVLPAAFLGLGLTDQVPDARGRRVLASMATCAIVGITAYVAGARLHGAASIPEFFQWIRSSSHGLTRSGALRAVVGLPGGLLDLGQSPREVKRFLMHDEMNPVAAADLIRLSVWPKMIAVYAALAISLVVAYRDKLGRPVLLTFLAAMVPIGVFSVSWQGSDLERYLPVFPFLFVLLGLPLAKLGRRRGGKAGLVILSLAGVLLTASAYGPGASAADATDVRKRLGCVGDLLDSRSMMIFPTHLDPMIAFARARVREVPRTTGATMLDLFLGGSLGADGWEQRLHDYVDGALSNGYRVWIPRYARLPVPPRSAGWVEGERAGVSWADIQRGFGQLRVNEPCGGSGDFVEVKAL